MKRPISSFTVEVRRRPSRAAANAAPAPKWFEADPPAGGGGPDARRAAAAAFEPRRPPDPSPETQPTLPQGRVLPSLVETVPLDAAPGDEVSTLSRPNDEPEEEARIEIAPRLKRPRRTTSSPVRRPPIESVVIEAMPEPPPAFEPAKALKIVVSEKPPELKLAQEIVAPPPQPLVESTPEPEASPAIVIPPADPARKKRSYTKSKVAKRPTPPLPEAPMPAMTADRPAPSADVSGAEPSKRKRKIMSRYVYRDEYKLGELWKKRLRKSR